MKPRFVIALFLALVMVALAATYAVAQPNITLPGSGNAKPPTYDVTFTKWITAFPTMIGVVGGAVGPGTFAGQILDLQVDGNMEYVDAIYHVNGGKHAFTARIHATQNDSLHSGVIIGSVTDGWLEGATLTGEYDVLAECPILTPGNGMGTLCFQGVLHLRPGDQNPAEDAFVKDE